MCGRFNYGSNMRHVHGWSDIFEEWPNIKTSFNVAPSATIASFRSKNGEAMRWGMVPKWSEDFETNYSTFNARIESIDEKPTFRSAWKSSHRCIIPITGYYEWKGSKGNKQPYYITDNKSGGLFLAGLYDSWKLDKFLSCTILTKPADKEMVKIHNRLPIMLTPESADDWLSCRDNIDKDVIANIPRPELVYYPVSKAVNSTLNNRESLIEPIIL